ncbi:NDP-hexose 2,3-dehydratase family protein [Bosea thiooxidans]
MANRLSAVPQSKFCRDAQLLFLRSALTVENPFNSTQQVLGWLQERNRQVKVSVDRIPFSRMSSWAFDAERRRLAHSSGSFFSIDGINVQTNAGPVQDWDQPIINQPEIGYLGVITKVFNGTLYFLLQAKIEPGNVNNVQLSPTLQATKSNYTRIHKGKSPNYLDYFTDRRRCEILLDQLQSDQGARFLKKRNRNIIIKADADIEILDDFCWLTLGQIKELMGIDNVVNMDTRTVISGISYGNHLDETVRFYNLVNRSSDTVGTRLLASELNAEVALHTTDEIIHWFTHLKTRYDLLVRPLPLKSVRDWIIEDDCIRHKDEKFFRVIGVHVEIANREVTGWDQPIIEPMNEGICAFIAKEIKGVIHFLVQAKVESGNFDILEMAPTVQCITSSYDNTTSRRTLPYLSEVLTLATDGKSVIYDTLQSEEGGRFYREQNRNVIIMADDDFPEETPENYIWMTLNQLKIFNKFNNYLNIQARSLIAGISFT